MSFGGGRLTNFGINSNTSANGFIKCLYKRWEINQAQQKPQSQSPNVQKTKIVETTSPDGSPVRKKLKEKNCGLEEDDSEEGDMVEEDEVY